MRSTATSTALAIAFQGDAAPSWVMLFPATVAIASRDGRRFSMTPEDAQAVIDHFDADAREVYVDVEHATQLRASQGLDAPAVGWIGALELRDGALWGQVAWTDRGAELLATRAYRYISPTFFHDTDGRVLRLEGAGLTNSPALRLPAVARRRDADKETRMDPELMKALGLPEGASAADALDAARTLATAAAQAQAQLATARAQGADAQLYVPRADFEAATARVRTLEEAETARRQADEEAAVGEAVEAGKITPAARDYHLASCRAMGAAAFRAAMAEHPVIALARSQSAGDARQPGEPSAASLTAQQLAICKQMNIAPEAYAERQQREKDLAQ